MHHHLLLLPLLIALAAAYGCGKNPADPSTDPSSTIGKNLLVNGSFTPTADIEKAPNIVPGLVEPWHSATLSPQIAAGAGCDNKPGYLLMWGCSDEGEGVYQMLRQPIRKGHRYLVRANIRWEQQSAYDRIHFATVRFVAFDSLPTDFASTYRWSAAGPGISVIGSVTMENTGCKTHSLPTWTATADYRGFAFNVENLTRQDSNVGNQSWALIDDVELIDLGE